MSEVCIFEWAQRGNVQELSILLLSQPEFGLEVKNEKGQTPLIIAVENGHRAFAHTLINTGADVNAFDNLGNTALMKAAMKGDLILLRLLLQNGANIDLENTNSMTAYDWAKAYHRKNILGYLRANDNHSKVELKSYFGALKQKVQEFMN